MSVFQAHYVGLRASALPRMPKETARRVFTRLAGARLQDLLLSRVTAEDNSKRQALQRLCGRTAGVRLQATSHSNKNHFFLMHPTDGNFPA